MEKCPDAIRDGLSALHVVRCSQGSLQPCLQRGSKLDNNDFPTSYNHYYTDAIQKQHLGRTQETLREAIEDATSQTKNDGYQSMHMSTHIDLDAVVTQVQSEWNRDLLSYSYEHVLDCLLAMYKDKMKTFIQNVVTQVVERHLIRGLDKIFSPLQVSEWNGESILKVAG
jgi:hypothetical protein